MFFFFEKQIIILIEDWEALLQNITKISSDIFFLKVIFTDVAELFSSYSEH